MKGNGALSSLGVGLCVFSGNRGECDYEPEFNAWNNVIHVHIVLGSFFVTCVWPVVR